MRYLTLSTLAGCFFLSGAAGLIYQTAWAQQLAVVFGTSEEAVVAVLAAYMAGLAAGARLAGRLVKRVGRPVRIYALLEVGIALSALSVPAWIELAGHLQILLLGGGDLPRDGTSIASTLFYLAASFAVLFLPTGLMGATLPLLARHAVRKEGQIGPRIALLYGMNTVGAAAGALASAFLLLPALGLGHTIWIAAALNLLVAAWAAGFLRDRAPEPITTAAEDGSSDGSGDAGALAAPRGARPAAGWILPAIAVSGVVSFGWEVVWTRLLGQFLGGSIYAFAVVLASFLIALGLGSLLAIPWLKTREQARAGFVVAQIAIAGLSILAFLAADRLPHLAGSGPDRVWAPWLAAAVIFPGALAIGLTFPCAVRIAARDARGTPEASARVFAWNTAGAILGALATGYLALPRLHFAGTAAAAALVSLVLALFAASVRRPRRPVLAGIAGIGVATLVLAPPAAPWGLLRYSPMAEGAVPGKVEYFGVGRGATVLLTEHHGEWRLLTNGLPESSIESPAHRASRYMVARWLSLLPLAARPEARSLLVVGLGAGVTVEDVPPSIETVDVIELEPEVVRANRRVADRRRRDPLTDPRLRLHLLDARGALRLTGRRFDAIVSQPSHPWTAGASHLYTREFFALVRERLAPGGVMVQWMAFAFVDEHLLRSLVATVTDVFPHVELYRPHPGSLLLLASAERVEMESTAAVAISRAPESWARSGVLVPEDVLAARVLDSEGARRFGEGAALNTDSRNLLRMRALEDRQGALGPAGANRLFTGSVSSPRVDETFQLYRVRRLLRQRAVDRARQLAGSFEDPVARHTGLALVELASGRQRQGRAGLLQALQLAPSDVEALGALLALERQRIASGQPLPTMASLDPEARVVVEGWRRAAAGDWPGLARLEEGLSELDPRHPLFADATRLRVRWRAELGGAERCARALELLSLLLSPLPEPRDLLLRAWVGLTAEKPEIALAAIEEALASPSPPLRAVRRLLGEVPADPHLDDWRRALLRRAGE